MSERVRATSDRQQIHRRATDLLSQALELAAPERRRWLDQACGGDLRLRDEVESLLAQEAALDDGFLSRPAALAVVGEAGDDRFTDPAPADMKQLERYRILSFLGRGGMGRVYLAEQRLPVRRRVALKVVAGTRRRLLERFMAEGRALARLSHPNIASLYEVGTTEDGQLFIAMELVKGTAITAWCDARRLGPRQRLALFGDVCRGVHHIHERGILHRDLKPSNILVTEVDGRAVAKVIDFGVAISLDEPLLTHGELTHACAGSPSYMSPEAVRRRGGPELDARSDVYSLGLVLYELLVGLLPFDAERTLFETFLRLRSGREALAPSVRFTGLCAARRRQLADLRRSDERALARRLRGDLDAIVGKAIAVDRARRYSSPSDLAADLERHLDSRPIVARPPSLPYVATSFVRRHMGILASVSLVTLALSAGVASASQAHRANQEAERAQAALSVAREMSSVLLELIEVADLKRRPGGAATARELLDHNADRLPGKLEGQPLARAHLLHTIAEVYLHLGLFESAESLAAEALALRRDRLPKDHPDLLESLNRLDAIQSGRPCESAARLPRQRLSSRLSHSLATCQSRLTVIRDTERSSATSDWVKPAK